MDFMDVFYGSKELKRTIVNLSVRHEIPLIYICKEIGVDYKHFMQAYINSTANPKFSITERQVRKMLSILGIDVRMQFVINSNHDYKVIQNKLKEKHGYGHWSNKLLEEKERSSSSSDGIDTILD